MYFSSGDQIFAKFSDLSLSDGRVLNGSVCVSELNSSLKQASNCSGEKYLQKKEVILFNLKFDIGWKYF